MRRFLSCALILFASLAFAQPDTRRKVDFPFNKNDRVAWVGSSSTRIGVWPKTMQFLLATRHPDLDLTFERFTTGGGTFVTGLGKMDEWLTPYKPTVVFFNYGSNDAGAGEKALPQFKKNMIDAVAKAQAHGARVYLLTPQAADTRKSGEVAAARRTLYAETMLAFGKEKSWPVIDIHHPLAELQSSAQKADDAYTILKDNIHLTDPAYIAWGYYLYDRLNPPPCDTSATLTAAGHVTATTRCRIDEVKATDDGVTFTRADEVLPILPPQKLPPRQFVPLERLSPYLLKITDLPAGNYSISCNQKPLGAASSKSLAAGVNLNTLLLDSANPAPWQAAAKDWWDGKNLDQIGKTRWVFEVKKK